MEIARRSFLGQLASAAWVLLGGTQLTGCLGDSDSQSSAAAPGPVPQTGFATPTTSPSPPQPLNSGPVWQSSPTIEFIEGIPSSISVRQFVQDPDQDPLVITLTSGKLLPGITWNPNTAVLAYDGRPLGAKPNEPVVLTGLTFTADDRKR